MPYRDVPAKVLECFVVASVGAGAWPFDDGSNDPFWKFGVTPRDYRWKLELNIRPQSHSSHKTRKNNRYDGMDVAVGDYIASTRDGLALKIITIDYKSEETLSCTVEDVFRYNGSRDASGLGNGIFDTPTDAVIFSVNDDNLPEIDPLPPSGVGPTFYANLMSRFHTLDKVSNFIIEQVDHRFSIGQLVSANSQMNDFVLADDDHPYVVGTVSFINGPDHFTIDPLQKVVDNIDFLEGRVGDILYVDDSAAGQLTTVPGTNPVMIKLRDFTPTIVRNTIENATTEPGNVLSLNGSIIPTGGTLQSFALAVNAVSDHGCTAAIVPHVTIAKTDFSSVNSLYGEVLCRLPTGGFAIAINGQAVLISHNRYAVYRYADPEFATVEDIAVDVNLARIDGIVASVENGSLVLTNLHGGGITITNTQKDANGFDFAGQNSITGIPVSVVAPPGQFVELTARDSRAIDILNIVGDPIGDFGIYSVENGVKSAALYIEQGIRTASNYVVADMASRNSLDAILGDQAYVIDKGDGQWGLYLYTGGSWVVTATAEAAKVDSDTYVVEMLHGQSSVVLGRINQGSKVTSVTYEVLEAFNGIPSISVGDQGDYTRLSNNNDVDLKCLGSYIVTPSYVYTQNGDTILQAYLSAGDATTGRVRITITYQ